MYTSMQGLETCEIQKATHLLGLNISDTELNELTLGNTVSLEGRSLSEIGSIFILAEALSAVHSVKNITFRDLLEVFIESSCCCGVPIYRWKSEILGDRCLILTLSDGKPAVKISS
jgi:hypothetical protein